MKGKKEKSEQARINAVNERIQAQLKSKQIVQKALKACLDGKSSDPNPNHIVFDSSDDEGDKKNFDDLLGFGGDDDDANDEIDNDEAFAVKSQFEGKKGLKLMKMQQKIGNNPRFQIDERFANEDDDEDEEHEDGDDEEDGSDELKRNLSILEQVVGPKKMKAAGKRSVQFVDINQRRYDPSKSDHDKFVIKSKDSDEKPAKKKKKKTAAELPAPPVSEERFYEVQYDKLKEAFGSNEEEAEEKPAFSMASLFSMPKVDEEEDKQEDNMEVDHQQEAEDFLPHFSHFNEDSSGSEMDENYGNNDDEQVMTSSTKLSTTEVSTATTITNKVDTKHDEMLKEMRRLSKTPWSLIPTKERLEEVRKFAAIFPPKLSYEDRYTKWVEQKDTLREDYKKKHRDHMRAKKRHSKSQDDEQDDSLRTFI